MGVPQVKELEAELVSAENRILFLNDETQIVKEQLSNLDTGYFEEESEGKEAISRIGFLKRWAYN